MLDVAKPQGLVKRGNSYAFRIRVPKDLISIIGKHELKKTLGTSDFALAKIRRNKLAAQWDDRFAELRAAQASAVETPRSASLHYAEALARARTHVEETWERYRNELAPLEMSVGW
jgi:hypothetical protein